MMHEQRDFKMLSTTHSLSVLNQEDCQSSSHILLVLVPNVRSPKVEKNSSISFWSKRLRISASSRARSELRSLISNMRYFFFSWSNSSSSLSIWLRRVMLDSSNLKKNEFHQLHFKVMPIHPCDIVGNEKLNTNNTQFILIYLINYYLL